MLIVNITIVWDIAPYSPYVNGHFLGTFDLLIFDPEDEGDMILRNVDLHADYIRKI
jgi:hypothetical protein